MSDVEQLLSTFEPREIDTTRSLLECLQAPRTGATYRRIVMLLLRGHYASTDNYGDEFEHLKCYRWTSGADSTLSVGFTHLNDDKAPDNYPGVFVGIGDLRFTKNVIGNYAGESEDRASTFLTKEASLTLTVNHVTKEASDAYELADMSAMVLTALGSPFAEKTGAFSFEVEGYAEPKKKLPSPDRYYTVAMKVKISYPHCVTRSLESHRIRRIAMLLDTETGNQLTE